VVLSYKISKNLNNRKPQQCVLLVLLLPVWYQGVIMMEEVRVTLTLWRLASLYDNQFVLHRKHLCVWSKNHSLLPQYMCVAEWFGNASDKFGELNFLDPHFIFMYMQYNHCHRVTAHLQLNTLHTTVCFVWEARKSQRLKSLVCVRPKGYISKTEFRHF